MSGVSDQVHGISTLKVSLTKLEYVVCRKRLKIFRLANLSVEAILQTKFQAVLPFSKSKFLIFIVKISLNSLDCIRYFLENSLKFH